MNATKETIIQKIKKLIALAGNNPNEHERGQAMEAAQKLLDEHNLKMADCQEKTEIIGYETMPMARDVWRRAVQNALAALYYVTLIGGVRNVFGDKEVAIIGTPGNRAAFLSISNWILDSIEHAATAAGLRGVKERNEFGYGCAITLNNRVLAILAEEKAAHAISTDFKSRRNTLMVLRKTAKEDQDRFVSATWGKTRTARSTGRQRTDTIERGMKAGEAISLHKQVNGKTTKFLEQK
jgi:hypothetical protein